MSRLVSALRTVSLALAAGLGLAPTTSAAAPVTWRYDFTATIISVSYYHACYDFGDCADYEADGFATTYQGPASGSSGSGSLAVSFDSASSAGEPADFSYSLLGLPLVFGGQTVTGFDAAGPTVSLRAFDGYDLFQIVLGPAGGAGYLGYEQDLSGVDFAEVEFSLGEVVLDPGMVAAQVPLPATLPALAAGLAGLGWIGRRARRS